MKPLGDVVLLELLEQEEEKMGVILIAKPSWAKPQNIGKATAVGNEVSDVIVDRLYYFNPYAVIDTDDPKVKLIRRRDILCEVNQE